MSEIVRVIKDKNLGEIRTFASASEIGAERDLEEFLKLVCLRYGNPTFTLTIEAHISGMLAASREEIREMKKATVAVAAVNLGNKK